MHSWKLGYERVGTKYAKIRNCCRGWELLKESKVEVVSQARRCPQINNAKATVSLTSTVYFRQSMIPRWKTRKIEDYKKLHHVIG